MLKKLLASFLGFIILISLTTISSIYVARNLLSGQNIVNLVDQELTALTEDFSYSNLFYETTGNEEYKKLDKYINEEELKKAYGDIVTDMIKYSTNVPNADKPSIKELKELIYKYCQEYEKDTKNKVDYKIIDETFTELETKLTDTEDIKSTDTTINKIFKFIYSDTIIYGAVAITLICIISMFFLLCKSLISLLKHFVTILFFNALGSAGLGKALNTIFSNNLDNQIKLILNNITSTFNKITIISIIFAIIFLIIIIILKIITKKKEEKSKLENSNEINNYESDVIETLEPISSSLEETKKEKN